MSVVRTIFLAVLLSLNFFILFKANFASYITGVGDFWDARNYLQTIDDVHRGTSPYALSYMQTLGPPLVIAPYIPLSFFPRQMALSLFTMISIIGGYLSCWLLAKKYWEKSFLLEKSLLLGLGLFSAFPTRFNFITGQWGLMSVLLLTIYLVSSSPKIQGVAIGLLMVLKTFFAFILLALQSKKIIGWACMILVIAAVVSLPLLKPAFYLEYRQRFAGVMWQPDKVINVAYYNQSFKTTFSRLGLVDESVPIWIMVSLIAAGYCLWSRNVAAAVIASIVLSPVAWQHYYVVLFPLFISTFSKAKKSRWWMAIWMASFYFWWTEFSWLHLQPLQWWTGLLGSHYLISALLLGSILVYNHHHET